MRPFKEWYPLSAGQIRMHALRGCSPDGSPDKKRVCERFVGRVEAINKFHGYSESPSQAVSTTKSTKDTKRDFKFICSAIVIFVFFVVK
jgi:hypothetical protein